jgi:hypothetical protein
VIGRERRVAVFVHRHHDFGIKGGKVVDDNENIGFRSDHT